MTVMKRFSNFAWGVLAANLAVIVWGAFVRATGSGAGCGSHWPLCNGEVVPRSPELATVIEFSHRLTSGMALVLILILWVWALRTTPTAHRVRRAASASLIFVLIEAAIGAGLVLLGLVAQNTSLLRVVVLMLHLANTFFLLAALTLTAFWSSASGAHLRLQPLVWSDKRVMLLAAAFGGLILVGMTGGLAAFGDTLFPVQSLQEGLAQDLNSSSHLAVRLRVLHPILAISVGLFVAWLAANQTSGIASNSGRWRWSVIVLVCVQLVVGVSNFALLAPVGIQMVHLFLAEVLWVSLVLFAVETQSAT